MGFVKIEANASKERYKELREDAERQVDEAKAAIQSAQDGEDAPDQSDVFLSPEAMSSSVLLEGKVSHREPN